MPSARCSAVAIPRLTKPRRCLTMQCLHGTTLDFTAPHLACALHYFAFALKSHALPLLRYTLLSYTDAMPHLTMPCPCGAQLLNTSPTQDLALPTLCFAKPCQSTAPQCRTLPLPCSTARCATMPLPRFAKLCFCNAQPCLTEPCHRFTRPRFTGRYIADAVLYIAFATPSYTFAAHSETLLCLRFAF